jgi:nucleoside-diphosphate-sugar epimerase
LNDGVSVCYGSLLDPDALADAVKDVEAVVHCAGKTKALRDREYFTVNGEGTENVVRAASGRCETIRHFVLVSSLAVSGPASPGEPARETDPPRPVSVYGRSKLEGEEAVRRMTEVPWTILRPAAIYGPRDRDFLPVFRAARRGVALLPFGGRQALSLVYGPDVAEAVRQCLGREEAVGKTYHVAADPPSTVAQFVYAVAAVMDRKVRAVSVPKWIFHIACVLQDWISRWRRRPHALNRQKWPELRATGWVCATDRIRDDFGFVAPTSLAEGLTRTAAWYTGQAWL